MRLTQLLWSNLSEHSHVALSHHRKCIFLWDCDAVAMEPEKVGLPRRSADDLSSPGPHVFKDPGFALYDIYGSGDPRSRCRLIFFVHIRSSFISTATHKSGIFRFTTGFVIQSFNASFTEVEQDTCCSRQSKPGDDPLSPSITQDKCKRDRYPQTQTVKAVEQAS